MRSVLNNDRFENIFDYYSDILWHLDGHWSDRNAKQGQSPDFYREVRLITDQYCKIREKVQAFTTFAQLEEWLNQKPFEVQAVPLNLLRSDLRAVEYTSAKILRIEDNEEISYLFDHEEGVTETVKGSGWDLYINFPVKVGKRLSLKTLRLGLAAMGIYPYTDGYDRDDHNPAVITVRAFILDRDFNMTDGFDKRFNSTLILDDDEEEEDPDDSLEDWIEEQNERDSWSIR